MAVASAATGLVSEAIGSRVQSTTVRGRLAVNYPIDHPTSYFLVDSLGTIGLIPGTSPGNLYRYDGMTIDVTGNLVGEGEQRTLYIEKWVPVGVGPKWPGPSPVTGVQTVLFLLVRFSNISGTHVPSYFQSLITRMAFYFEQDSYSMVTVRRSPTVQWYTLSHPSTYYNVHTWDSCGSSGDFEKLAEDAIHLVDPYVNYQAYNHFLIVTPDSYVWGCRVRHDVDTHEGTIHSYSFVSENDDLRTYVHEFSHDLGLPDLYDYSCSTNPPSPTCDPYDFIDGWDPMSHSPAATPQHHSAWSKMQLGWIPESKIADIDVSSGEFGNPRDH